MGKRRENRAALVKKYQEPAPCTHMQGTDVWWQVPEKVNCWVMRGRVGKKPPLLLLSICKMGRLGEPIAAEEEEAKTGGLAQGFPVSISSDPGEPGSRIDTRWMH
jgi:hypothetical protein